MNRTLIVFLFSGLLICLAVLSGQPTSATSPLQAAFVDKYGAAIINLYGCNTCHSPASLSELNPYGRDMADAISSTGGGCLEFHPPNTHTMPYGRCQYLHAEGLSRPFTSKCTTCHGVDLRGLIAPSCYLCHGRRWSETAPAAEPAAGVTPAAVDAADALAAIEQVDSDGDGYTNIEEINALTHPGDPASTPGTVGEVKVSLEKKWMRDWFTSRGDLAISLEPKAGSVDAETFVTLKTKAGELYTTRFRNTSTGTVAYFPRALLFTLFKNLGEGGAEVVVTGLMSSGAEFSAEVSVKLKGAIPKLLRNLTLVSSPREWERGKDVTLTLVGGDVGNVDLSKPIKVVGLYGSVFLGNATRSDSTLTGTVKGSDVARLIATPVKDMVYTIALVGSAADGEASFAVSADVTAKGPTCLEFKPPADHTVVFQRGECAYRHAPGYDSPFADGCNNCHGADLKGSPIAPSCYLCHGAYWSAAQPDAAGSWEEE